MDCLLLFAWLFQRQPGTAVNPILTVASVSGASDERRAAARPTQSHVCETLTAGNAPKFPLPARLYRRERNGVERAHHYVIPAEAGIQTRLK